jgi:hypothetical protein
MSTILDPAPPRRRWTRLIGVPVAAASLAGLVACGTDAASTTTSNTAMAAFASCMAENGVTLPQRGDGGGSPPTGTPPAGGTGEGAGGPGGSAAGGGGRPGQNGGAMAPPSGVDATTWAAAQKACAQYAPTPPSGAPTAE